jgi:glycosyltransferase involved in cell wall biosynthesis
MKVIGRVLPLHQGYKAVLAGAGENRLQRLRSRLPADLQRRIEIVGHVENRVMLDHYLSARILLFTSRFEGFPFAVSEALCCGCTIVGAATVPALNYVCCGGGGTLAASRAVRDYADALSAEIDAWRDGQRDPEGISHYWIARASAKAVASAILGFFAQCAGSQTGSPDREDRLINP